MGDLNYNYGTEENKYLYQGKELQDEHNLNWMDFGARMYDPQIGRWHCADPAGQFASPYLAMGNNPINAVDPNGMWIRGSVVDYHNNLNWRMDRYSGRSCYEAQAMIGRNDDYWDGWGKYKHTGVDDYFGEGKRGNVVTWIPATGELFMESELGIVSNKGDGSITNIMGYSGPGDYDYYWPENSEVIRSRPIGSFGEYMQNFGYALTGVEGWREFGDFGSQQESNWPSSEVLDRDFAISFKETIIKEYVDNPNYTPNNKDQLGQDLLNSGILSSYKHFFGLTPIDVKVEINKNFSSGQHYKAEFNNGLPTVTNPGFDTPIQIKNGNDIYRFVIQYQIILPL